MFPWKIDIIHIQDFKLKAGIMEIIRYANILGES